MSNPYVGEIRMFAGNFAPVGWAFCQGQVMPIAENETLFQLIGTTYGGDGQSTFNLPNLASRVPMHMGTNAGQAFVIGQMAGEEQVTLTTQQIPAHSHVPTASTQGGNSKSPLNGILAGAQTGTFIFSSAAPTAAMAPAAVQSTGGSQPHDNMIPFLVINFIISLFGIFPTPT